jgi:hypothetical protein
MWKSAALPFVEQQLKKNFCADRERPLQLSIHSSKDKKCDKEEILHLR